MAEFNGTNGDDVYFGTADGDYISGEAGDDQLSGGGSEDLIEGGDDDDVINGDGGDDALFGDSGNDLLNGGDGFDFLSGGTGNDQLSGGADDDILLGEADNDTLSGGSGNDVLRGGSGIDSFDGGTEIIGARYGDRVDFTERRATQSVVADLRTGQISNDGYGNAETMVGIESLGGGTAFADTFYGSDVNNFLYGGRGDTLMSFGGDDLLAINGAPAVLDGGTGIDFLRLENFGGFLPDSDEDGLAEDQPPMDVGYTIDLAAGTLTDGHGFSGTIAGIERIAALSVDDTLRGSGADEWFAPGYGNDTVDGRGGVDTIS